MTYLLRLILVTFIVSPVATYGTHNPIDPYFSKTADGVIIYPDASLAGNTRAVRLQVISDRIIRVLASPQKDFPVQKSLVIQKKDNLSAPFDIVPGQNKADIILKTKFITAIANIATGHVVFFDAAGKLILNEEPNGRQFQETVLEGERTYNITQEFDTTPDDAWYGLGQHQDGIMNYKNNQVFLWQDNTEVAVPFLVSNKNYGILWDNNSFTKAGDTRDYKSISSLKLFAKDGQAGWLTATYRNDRSKPDVFVDRAESAISMEWLGESTIKLPTGFNPQLGMVTWEGSFASELSGIHKLRFTYGGYIKVYIDGKLVEDRWRVAWKPGSMILDVRLEKDKKVPVRIEWIPDGSESYISLKYMEPASLPQANARGFASEAGKQADYYFIYGDSMDEVIGGYRDLTGKAAILPIWAYGFWQSRERYKTQDEILNTVKEFRSRKIPLDNIVLDWSYWKQNAWGSQDFDASRFSNPDSMIQVLHDQYKTHFMISVWPKFYEGIETYKEFDKKGWLYKRNIANRQRDWIGQGYISTFYDAFNEDAQKGFWELINKKIYAKGVDAWWMDASEPDILSNVPPAKRKELMYPLAAGITSEYVNAYPLENAKGIYEGQRKVDPNKRVFILTRSAFPGIQRYAAATWSGDISSRWDDLKTQISAGVNFSMSGLPNWTMDIGGFAVEKRYEKPNTGDLEEWRELNTRWYQFGTFVPLMRVHGQFPYREIYNTAPEDHPAYKSMLYYSKLRYYLLPYIYSMAGMTYHKNYTIMRGMVMDFASDPTVNDINDQYLFGPSLLINPVCDFKAKSRNVYLPKGQNWYDLYTGKSFNGGQTIEAAAVYERIPVFVKAGSILPIGPALQYTTEKKPETIQLYVYAGKDGAFTLYEDEGVNYNYEKGKFATIPFTYSDKDKKLTIGKREGQFDGMLIKRVFKVKYITPAKPGELAPEKSEGKTINYNGTAVTVSLN